jgi:hypothetical protein
MHLREAAESGKEEIRGLLPVDLLLESAHNLGKGLRHCLGALCHEILWGHEHLSPCASPHTIMSG